MYQSLIIVLFLYAFGFNQLKHKLTLLDHADVKVNGTSPLKSNTIDFKRSSKIFLQTPYFKFDRFTRIDDVEKLFDYNNATRGTDMDLYTAIFIRAGKHKNSIT